MFPRALPLVQVNDDGTFHVVDETVEVLSTKFDAPLSVLCIAGLFRTGKSFLLNRIILTEPGGGGSPVNSSSKEEDDDATVPASSSASDAPMSTPTTRQRARAAAAAASSSGSKCNRSGESRGGGGFRVGNTVQACTKGIWMWSEPLVVRAADGTMVNVCVIDTEGSGSPAATSNHDARIASLGLLLSSFFVYNSVGRIDDSALSALTTVTHVTSQLHAHAVDGCAASPSPPLPGFLWVLRDFALQLQGVDGGSVDSDTYMEESLSGEKQDARQHLRQFFRHRGCATLIRPVMEESELQHLDDVPDAQLRPEFVAAARSLRHRILLATAGRPLRHHQSTTQSATSPLLLVGGSMVAGLLHRYVASINSGAVPHIYDAWDSVVALERMKAEKQMLSSYPPRLAAVYERSTAADAPPTSVSSFRDALGVVVDDVWSAFASAVSSLGVDVSVSARDVHDVYVRMLSECASYTSRYEASWRLRVESGVTSLVDSMVSDVDTYESWSVFRDALTERLGEFQQAYGTDDATQLILWREAFKLLDVVPHYFGDTPDTVQRVSHLSQQVVQYEEQLESLQRSAKHQVDALTLELSGAVSRASSVEEDVEELTLALTKAREEVRCMTEQVCEASELRGQVSAHVLRVQELEDMLTRCEDDAARKQADAHLSALKSVDALKQLREADAKQFATELASVKASEEGAQSEISKLKQECAKSNARARACSERVSALSVELEDATTKANLAARELRAKEDTERAVQLRVVELERQVHDAESRVRKKQRVSGDSGDAVKLVKAETELLFLRSSKSELASALATEKARCVELERQIRSVQRSADETVQRERLKHETALAQMEMRGMK